jgi:NADPH:quinone reductase
VIATAGSPDKVKLCTDLGAEVAIDYRNTEFAEAVLDATDGRGVDVAFDSIGGDVTVQTFRCMAFNGRHVLAGFAAGIEAEDTGIIPRPILFGNLSLAGVPTSTTRGRSSARPVRTSRRAPTASASTPRCSRSWRAARSAP